MSRTVYLAGPYSSRDLLAGYGQELSRVGYQVRAEWLGGSHEVESNEAVERAATEGQRAHWAAVDLRDISNADLIIAFTSDAVGGGGHSGGRHVETGYALALNKVVILVGEPENVFHWHARVKRFPTWHEALIELSAQLVQHEQGRIRTTECAS